MAKIKTDWELNRKQYLLIKKMDHNEMQEYLNAVYKNGLVAGKRAAASSFDAKLAMEAIGNIKGIGPAKMEQIKLAMMAAGAKMPEESA